MSASTVPDDVLHARAYLSRVAEPASFALWRLVAEYGPSRAAALIRSGEVPRELGEQTSARRARIDPDADLEAAARHGIRLVVPESPDWPHLPFGCLDRAARDVLAGRRPAPDPATSTAGDLVPPLALWVKGRANLAEVGLRSAAIVGARGATSYGQHVAAELAYGMASRGVLVVSGGAYGIDAVAHRGALAAGGQTVIVSAGGVDRPYPSGNASLFGQAADDGLILSESPPGCAPQRHRFLSRNRLIAALGTGTVVVEAAARSGALNTARHARDLGRPLMVVPGPVTSAMSIGCHRLLRDESYGAILVETVDQVLSVVGSPGEGLFEQRSLGTSEDPLTNVLDQLDATAHRVFDALGPTRYVDEQRLAALAGLGVRDVLRALATLRLAGLIDSTDAGHRISPALRSSAC
jgi:DNA processing protein